MLTIPGSVPKRIYDFFSLTAEFEFKAIEECVLFKIPRIHTELIAMDRYMSPCLIDLEVVFGANFKFTLMDYIMDPRTQVHTIGGVTFFVARG